MPHPFLLADAGATFTIRHVTFTLEGDGLTVDGAPVTIGNFILFVAGKIDAPIPHDPETPTITETILAVSGDAGFDDNGADFDILREALAATDLTGAVADEAADLTVFAPTDAAFIQLARDLGADVADGDETGALNAIIAATAELAGGAEEGLALIKNILLYHVAPGGRTLNELQGEVQCLFGPGVAVGVLIGKVTEYYTSTETKPVHTIANKSETGSATNIIAGLAVAAGLFLLIAKTRLGVRIRAGESDREMIAALGVDIDKLYTIVFALGAALAGFAGAMVGALQSVEVGMGEPVLILAFVVIVIGGVGSIKGALFGAILVGVTDTMGRVLLPVFFGTFMDASDATTTGSALASMLIYILMALVLIFKPSGLFGARA
ncbi:MAG: sodium/proton-translocating pyrophosphatase [Pseudomonadota bacterium]